MSKALKIFLSVPMAGRTDEQLEEAIKLEHIKIKALMRGYDIEIVDGRDTIERHQHSMSKEDIYKECLKLLHTCDICAMADAWEYSYGCKSERKYAADNGIPIILTETEYTRFIHKGVYCRQSFKAESIIFYLQNTFYNGRKEPMINKAPILLL